ncbi:phosphotransferase family protein [Allostreptomyces psammosilenae]|uniref:Aminoglycoside phosphotransferase domain-containing protein n=1 Tax=Allostreptomyces psammosilenae TaxID=1892865 RepID=A0A852ZUE8_9ACTN|nr:phosphotransferase [Allostreptomyces psammosilenae]NYI04394.1 hypothetical protein [Allostreptomyces psammosilenae]
METERHGYHHPRYAPGGPGHPPGPPPDPRERPAAGPGDRAAGGPGEDRGDGFDPLAVLVAADLLDEPAAPAVRRVDDISRSHRVHRVVLRDGRAYVVKRLGGPAREPGRELDAELYVYRMASWLPGVSAAVPEPVMIDELGQVLVLPAAPPHQVFPACLGSRRLPPPVAAGALGRAAAGWHHATEGIHLPRPASRGPLGLPRTPPSAWLVGGAAARALALGVVAAPDLGAALEEGARLWAPRCLVHADLMWDNCLVDAAAPPRVRVIDWELSGYGDPAWDVGCVVAEQVSLAVRAQEHALRSRDPRARQSGPTADILADRPRLLGGLPAAAAPAVAAFAAGYAAALPARPEPDFWYRAVLYAVARLVYFAIGGARWEDAEDCPFAVAHLSAARQLHTTRIRTADALRRKATR